LKFLSVNNIVIPAANTGRDNDDKTAVINTDHTNKGNALNLKPGNLKLITVAIKFIAPKIEEIPDKCKLNIAKSTEQSEVIADNGG
jgi:HPt (histidine-containing phosphotransfer) domain-containing protein